MRHLVHHQLLQVVAILLVDQAADQADTGEFHAVKGQGSFHDRQVTIWISSVAVAVDLQGRHRVAQSRAAGVSILRAEVRPHAGAERLRFRRLKMRAHQHGELARRANDVTRGHPAIRAYGSRDFGAGRYRDLIGRRRDFHAVECGVVEVHVTLRMRGVQHPRIPPPRGQDRVEVGQAQHVLARPKDGIGAGFALTANVARKR